MGNHKKYGIKSPYDNIIGDFDSDSGFTTNQKDIVEWAKKCATAYPTIVNKIPKEKLSYNNTADDYANVDNALAEAQMAIGTSSNLAQIAQSYATSLTNADYDGYVAMLAVLAQCAIDNAKRRSVIDLNAEIDRLRGILDIKSNGYPLFWSLIKGDEMGSKAFINNNLECPMNYLATIKIPVYRKRGVRPTSDFFSKELVDRSDMRKNRKVEEMIERFSDTVFKFYYDRDFGREFSGEYGQWIILEDEFNELIDTINKMYIGRNYKALMIWLLDRALNISPSVVGQENTSKLKKNRAVLIATLYKCNPKLFLECFNKNITDKK